jgi:hypothetical protein
VGAVAAVAVEEASTPGMARAVMGSRGDARDGSRGDGVSWRLHRGDLAVGSGRWELGARGGSGGCGRCGERELELSRREIVRIGTGMT